LRGCDAQDRAHVMRLAQFVGPAQLCQLMQNGDGNNIKAFLRSIGQDSNRNHRVGHRQGPTMIRKNLPPLGTGDAGIAELKPGTGHHW
jgi:hypothetical protein